MQRRVPLPSVQPAEAGGLDVKEAVYSRLDSAPPIWGAPHSLEECATLSVPNVGGSGSGWTIQGHSIAGERTGFVIQELKLFLDGGMSAYRQPSNILVTHSHIDHTKGLIDTAMGGMDVRHGPAELLDASLPPVYIVQEAVEPVQLMARAVSALNTCRALKDRQAMNVLGVSCGDEMVLPCGKKGGTKVHVRVVKCVHTVPCVGYVLSTVSRKLLPELEGAGSEEIARRKKEGQEVTTEVRKPIMAFLGDTTPAVFEENEGLEKVPTVFVECTGYLPGTEEKMASRGHTHWSVLRPVVERNRDTTFVLMHISQGVKEGDAVNALVASGLPNVILWLDSGVVEIRQLLPTDQDSGGAEGSHG
mmetsp:Transcript_12044/g.30130  ORF Transcript_12044/g.30130 Transcript_12044/m.30130 type:complete len:361 (+) Transcript_12044:46-1128(+)